MWAALLVVAHPRSPRSVRLLSEDGVGSEMVRPLHRGGARPMAPQTPGLLADAQRLARADLAPEWHAKQEVLRLALQQLEKAQQLEKELKKELQQQETQGARQQLGKQQQSLQLANRNESESKHLAEVVYTSSSGESLAMCACAKCGTTALAGWLYKSIFGAPFVNTGHKPWVQDYKQWPAPPQGSLGNVSVDVSDRTSMSYEPDTTLVITLARDPLERYASSFRSKVRCTRVMLSEAQAAERLSSAERAGGMAASVAAQRKSDVEDGNQAIPELLRAAGLDASLATKNLLGGGHGGGAHGGGAHPHGVTACLAFDDFALALRLVHAQGEESVRGLNSHWAPQGLAATCHGGEKLNVAQLADRTAELTARFGLHETSFEQTHATTAGGPDDTSDAQLRSGLCAVVPAEYKWLGDEAHFNEVCKAGEYTPL